MFVRRAESLAGSVTGGNGSICAVRKADYIEHRFGHDLGFPYRLVQRRRRAVFEPDAHAFEKPSAEQEDEYRRKVRMFEWCWMTVFEGSMFRRLTPLYWVELVSHRLLRYAERAAPSARARAEHRPRRPPRRPRLRHPARPPRRVPRARLPRPASGLRVPGASLAYYYTLVTWATVVALVRYLRFGVPGCLGEGGERDGSAPLRKLVANLPHGASITTRRRRRPSRC